MNWLLDLLAKVYSASLRWLLVEVHKRMVVHPFEEEIFISISIFMMLVVSKQHIMYLNWKSFLQWYCLTFPNIFWCRIFYQMFCAQHAVNGPSLCSCWRWLVCTQLCDWVLGRSRLYVSTGCFFYEHIVVEDWKLPNILY